MAVSDWSTTAASNTSVGGVNIAEHCPAANLNDGMRAIMAEAKAKFDTIDSTTSSLSSSKASLSGATFTGNVTVKGVFDTPVAVPASDIDLSGGSVFTKTLSGAITFTFSNAAASLSSCFCLILTNGGNYTVTWPVNVKWAGDEAPELTSSGIDVISFISPDGGTTWYGVPSILDAQ